MKTKTYFNYLVFGVTWFANIVDRTLIFKRFPWPLVTLVLVFKNIYLTSNLYCISKKNVYHVHENWGKKKKIKTTLSSTLKIKIILPDWRNRHHIQVRFYQWWAFRCFVQRRWGLYRVWKTYRRSTWSAAARAAASCRRQRRWRLIRRGTRMR